jgi:hypothetical protein
MAVGTGYLPISSTSRDNPLPANSGMPWCRGYREFAPRDEARIGPYRLINLPGRQESQIGNIYVIAPDDRTGRRTSRIELTWISELPLAGQGATFRQLDELWRSEIDVITSKLDIDAPKPRFGTRVARLVEIRERESGSVRSGVFNLISPSHGVGGISIVATRDGPAPTEATASTLLLLQEQLAAVEQVFNRLCGPDESGTVDSPNLNVACLIDQQ